MILNALCEYYDILSKDNNPKIPSLGYSMAKVGYAIVLDRDGEILRIDDLRNNSEGKKMFVPEQAGRTSGVSSIFSAIKLNMSWVWMTKV